MKHMKELYQKVKIEDVRREQLCGKRIYDIPLRVTFYGRVSTDEDRQKDSLEHQIAYFSDKINSHSNWTYVEGYVDEGITGTRTDKRTQFLRMIDDAKAGAFDLILTKEVSRFARDVVDCVQTSRDLLRYDVGVFIEDLNLNTMEPDAEFRLSIMAIVAQEESRKTSERVKFGYRQTMKQGKRHGATPPIGYVFNQENNGYSIDPIRAKVVQYVFEEYSKREMGTRRIAEELANRGFLNDAGHPYNPSTIERMIRNPIYKGYIVNGKSHKPSYREDTKVSKPRDEWLLHYDPERVPPLVEDALWDKANYILAERSKRMEGVDCRNKDDTGGGKYAYSNRILCDEHETGYNRALSRWSVNGEKKTAEYWRCNLYKKFGKKQCDGPLLYTRDLNAIMRELFSIVIPMLQDDRMPLSKEIERALIPDCAENDPLLLEQIKKELENKKKKLFDGWMNNVVSDRDYRDMSRRLEQQMEEIAMKAQDIRQLRTNVDVSARMLTIMSQTVANANLESEESIEELVRCIVKKIIVKRKHKSSTADNDKDRVNYTLEIWLYNGSTPANFDLSLCARTHQNRARRIGPTAV